MALTIETIRATEDDEVLVDLLLVELQRLLPESMQEDRDSYHGTLASLPRGLRAMAGMHFFVVRMSMDDLAWHFGNQNDERDLQETLDGLRELELTEIADMFEKMWWFMKPHMNALQSGDFGGKEFPDWVEETGAQKFADPMNKIIWDRCEAAAKLGLLGSWSPYARTYPERCIVAEAHP